MSEGLSVLIGMSIAYVASFVGLVLAWIAYRRRHKNRTPDHKGDADV